MRLFSFMTILLVTANALFASEKVDEIISLKRGGAEQQTLLNIIQSSNSPYNLSADDITLLENAGVSDNVILAMIDRDKAIAGDAGPVAVAANDTEVIAPAPEEQNISYFYEAMAPYGEWVSIPETGWVWRPTGAEIQVDWRPYSHGGQWIWTDNGWYWESSYAWGWAPFHYGRWSYNDRYHWVWAPDTTWGPAWVTWRSSDSYYGWAPLPIGAVYETGVGFSFHNRHVGFDFDFGLGERDYAFVPANLFLEVDIGRRLVPRTEVATVFRQTTVVREGYTSQGNQVFNRGIPSETVARRTGKRIETVKIADASVAAGRGIRGEARQGNTLTVFRPKLSATASIDPQTAVKRHQERVAKMRSDRAGRTPTDVNNIPGRTNTNATPLSESDAKKRLQEEKLQRQQRVDDRTKEQQQRRNDVEQKREQNQQRNTELEKKREQEQLQRRNELEQKRDQNQQRNTELEQKRQQELQQQQNERVKAEREAQQRLEQERERERTTPRQPQRQPEPTPRERVESRERVEPPAQARPETPARERVEPRERVQPPAHERPEPPARVEPPARERERDGK